MIIEELSDLEYNLVAPKPDFKSALRVVSVINI